MKDEKTGVHLIGVKETDGKFKEMGKNKNPLRTPEEEAMQLQKMNEAAIKDITVPEVELMGLDDSKLKRVVAFIRVVRDPRHGEAYDKLSQEDIYRIVEKHLDQHCRDIGWWPDGEGPVFVIKEKDDGTGWIGVAKLKESSMGGAKDWSSFDQISVDGRSSEDVKKDTARH